MKSPYKDPANLPVECRKIMGDVSVEDWNTIYLLCPFHGTQDFIIGTLIHALAATINQLKLPRHYEPTNISRLHSLLTGVTFTPALGAGHHRLHRRPEASLRICLATDKAESPDRSLR